MLDENWDLNSMMIWKKLELKHCHPIRYHATLDLDPNFVQNSNKLSLLSVILKYLLTANIVMLWWTGGFFRNSKEKEHLLNKWQILWVFYFLFNLAKYSFNNFKTFVKFRTQLEGNKNSIKRIIQNFLKN